MPDDIADQAEEFLRCRNHHPSTNHYRTDLILEYAMEGDWDAVAGLIDQLPAAERGRVLLLMTERTVRAKNQLRHEYSHRRRPGPLRCLLIAFARRLAA